MARPVRPDRGLAASGRRPALFTGTITRLQECIVVGGALVAYCAVAVLAIKHATSVYLPPDAAHYLGEADNYLGRGVLDFTHPPTFPLLTAMTRAVFGPLTAVLAAMTIGIGLTFLAVYLLLRQWLPVVPSLFGTSVGMLMPITAELLGWSGGAELLGIAFGVLTLAAFEWWCRTGEIRGVAVGGALGLTIISHPFGVAVVGLCLGVRWVVEFVHVRHFDRGWGPTGLRGLASFAITALPFALIAEGYYRGVSSPGSTTIGLPDTGTLGALLAWSTRENHLLLILTVAALGTAFITTHRGATAVSASLAGIIILVPILLTADSSYQARAIYYVPVLVAIGAAFCWVRVARWTKPVLDVRRWYALGIVLLVAIPVAIGTVGFVPRIQTAIPFYGPLGLDDVHLVQSLGGQRGSVATSWPGTDVAEGASMSWFVSGLARRPAYGPSGPWLEGQPSEVRSGQDMQRAFSGVVGIGNGALQLSALPVPSQPGGVLAGPYRPETDLQAAVPGVYQGFLFPFLALNSKGNQYPVAVNTQAAVPSTTGSLLAWNYPGSTLAGAVDERLSIHGRQTTVVMRTASGYSGAWKIYVRPAAGLFWSNLISGEHSLTLYETVGGQSLSATLTSTTPNTGFQYLPSDPLTGGQAVTIDGSGSRISFTLAVSGSVQPTGTTASFDQTKILSRYHVTNVAVFKSSGTAGLFDSACFKQGPESTSLVLFKFVCGSKS